MIKDICSIFDRVDTTSKEVSYALLATRISLALFFIAHGYAKFFGEMGLAGFTNMLAENSFPLAGLLAFLVAFAELFGGILILLGVMTRFWAFWLIVISFVAWWTIKGFNIGAAGDIDILAMGLAFALLFAGPGALSVSAKIRREQQRQNNSMGGQMNT